jgi:hypothetical protein
MWVVFQWPVYSKKCHANTGLHGTTQNVANLENKQNRMVKQKIYYK